MACMAAPAHPELPSAPSGHSRIGWAGFALALPEDWNLSFHSPAKSVARGGLLVFNDLRGPAFEIRWKSPRMLGVFAADPVRRLQRLAKKLQRKHTVESLPGAFLLPGKSMVLAATGGRIYELHCPRDAKLLTPITHDFLAATGRIKDQWLWSIYGIREWLPSSARLCKATFNPGQSELLFGRRVSRFARPGETWQCVSRALASQMLGGKSLRAWVTAELPLLRQFTKPEWIESENAATCRGQSKHTRHELTLRHDPQTNRLLWTHLQKRTK